MNYQTLAIVCMSIFLGVLLRGLFDSIFEKSKNFGIANLEDLSEGQYSVLDIKPNGKIAECFFIRNIKFDNPSLAICVFWPKEFSTIIKSYQNQIHSPNLINVECVFIKQERYSIIIKIKFTGINSVVKVKKVSVLWSRSKWEIVQMV